VFDTDLLLMVNCTIWFWNYLAYLCLHLFH